MVLYINQQFLVRICVLLLTTTIPVTVALIIPFQRLETLHCLPRESSISIPKNCRYIKNALLSSLLQLRTTSTNIVNDNVEIIQCPEISPATGLTNRFYTWKNYQKIRYQTTALVDDSSSSSQIPSAATKPAPQPILFIHGLFTNSDHWRHSLKYFSSLSSLSTTDQTTNYVAYAIDLFGCGYSDKPFANSTMAQACNGENHRFVDTTAVNDIDGSILRNVQLGSSDGQQRSNGIDVELRHPLGSPYNFYTWADLITDFCNDVILPATSANTVTLVCNSIGTISSLQAVIDHPALFNGVFVVSPNFRELHSAEVPFPSVTMPILRFQQQLLRNVIGQPLFDTLAKPDIVRDILKVPYAVKEAVDEELVQVLLDPLLTPGASNVVFDTLSYSAGPLPEPQLQQLSEMQSSTSAAATTKIPIWVCYGSDDPWTPGRRVEALQTNYKTVVEKVICLPGVGHCPHDEAPELVHPLLMDFLQRVVVTPTTTKQ